MKERVGVVVIGRNEGDRLRRCLESVRGSAARVYVDSGSSDGSLEAAKAEGCTVIALSAPPAHTAARARNAGIARLRSDHPHLLYIQLVDGDCEIAASWLAAGTAAMDADPGLCAVFGRLRERFPERSVYNALCDREWTVPPGTAGMFGGIVLLRSEALAGTSGYPEDMIAGEEPDLSMRLRAQGWRIVSIDAPMASHDAAMLRFGQWWRRAMRGGHAYAELAQRHPEARWPDWRRQVRSIVVWGSWPSLLAGTILASSVWRGALFLAALLVLAWLAQMARIAVNERRAGLTVRFAPVSAFFILLGKVPAFVGMVRYWHNRRQGRTTPLIEYKVVPAATEARRAQ